MRKWLYPAVAAAMMVAGSCSTTQKSTIPLGTVLELDDTYTIVWNGVSKAYRYDNGQWLRAEDYDYQFDVVQKRYNKQWKSVKSLHRIHPDYDGKAGDRDQTMYFEVAYSALAEGRVQASILSSIGSGTGSTDREFRESVLTMYVPSPSRFLPYNKFRITQHYQYEQGMLTETVELIKEEEGKETPFMKNEETALIFVKSKLEKAPTIFGN